MWTCSEEFPSHCSPHSAVYGCRSTAVHQPCIHSGTLHGGQWAGPELLPHLWCDSTNTLSMRGADWSSVWWFIPLQRSSNAHQDPEPRPAHAVCTPWPHTEHPPPSLPCRKLRDTNHHRRTTAVPHQQAHTAALCSSSSHRQPDGGDWSSICRELWELRLRLLPSHVNCGQRHRDYRLYSTPQRETWILKAYGIHTAKSFGNVSLPSLQSIEVGDGSSELSSLPSLRGNAGGVEDITRRPQSPSAGSKMPDPVLPQLVLYVN